MELPKVRPVQDPPPQPSRHPPIHPHLPQILCFLSRRFELVKVH